MTTDSGTWAMRPTLGAGVSRRMVDAAVAEASAMSVGVTVVAVDESGVLKELCRMDGAPLDAVGVPFTWSSAMAAWPAHSPSQVRRWVSAFAGA